MSKVIKSICFGLCSLVLSGGFFPLVASELVLDCRGGQEEKTSVTGYVGKTTFEQEKISVENVLVTIGEKKCTVDYGAIGKGTFPLISIDEQKIVCGKESDETNPSLEKKSVYFWRYSISRLNGTMNYYWSWKTHSNDDYIREIESKRTWQCQKAKKLF